jgi:hypothetical protein
MCTLNPTSIWRPQSDRSVTGHHVLFPVNRHRFVRCDWVEDSETRVPILELLNEAIAAVTLCTVQCCGKWVAVLREGVHPDLGDSGKMVSG